jgi:hypothetical protein
LAVVAMCFVAACFVAICDAIADPVSAMKIATRPRILLRIQV